MREDFEKIKKAVLDTIQATEEEVLPSTKIKKSGIYMIYVDCFDDDKIIPIYIGKSTNIQKRYKSHYQEILALNRLTFDEYKKYTENGYYEGSFKSCKIFKYMIEHNCSLCDYHMIPIEYCSEDILEEREQFYINYFLSEYFGFNQLNATSLSLEYRKSRNDVAATTKYILSVKTNAELLKKYWGYGFTIFNYEYAFYKTPLSRIEAKGTEIQTAFELTNNAIVDLSMFAESKYAQKSREITAAEKEIHEQIRFIESHIEPLEEKIEKQKKLIRKKFREQLQYSPTWREFEYFFDGMYDDDARKKFNAAMKRKNLRFLAYVRMKEDLEILEALDDEYDEVRTNTDGQKSEKYKLLYQLSAKRNALKSELRVEYLLPSIEFPAFALKDLKRDISVDNNTIYFIVSNNGRNSTPEIVKVLCPIGGETKVYYIKNRTTENARAGIEYVERYAYFRSNSLFGKREVYKIVPRKSEPHWGGLMCDNHISVLAEYNTGLNDFSLKDVSLVDLKEVIEEILPLISTTPKVKIKGSESQNVLTCALEDGLDKRTFSKIVKLI